MTLHYLDVAVTYIGAVTVATLWVPAHDGFPESWITLVTVDADTTHEDLFAQHADRITATREHFRVVELVRAREKVSA